MNVFCYENDLFYPVYVSDEKFERCIDLLSDVYIKYFNRFMCNKAKSKNKKHFCRLYLIMSCKRFRVNPHSIVRLVWSNGSVFVYELSGCGFESSCSHFCRYLQCFSIEKVLQEH